MFKRIKKILIVLVSISVLTALVFVLNPGLRAFFGAQIVNLQNAGTWENDPKNWFRAFNEDQPSDVKVIHSKYWKSNHFTDEFIYYFEVEATPEWKEAFLNKRSLVLVPASTARSFRTNIYSDMTPSWFAPDPVSKYDVWDKTGSFGSVWIDKSDGHIYFYDMQL